MLPWICLAAVTFAAARPARGTDEFTPPDGAQIYAASCVQCHGERGGGSEYHESRLEGDLSVAQLAELIGETMPEDDPGSLSAVEATAVASYVHDAFYSAIARARNQPARISLARLTVRQYRNAVADLIGSFAASPEWGDQRGLSGEYFGSRQPRGRGDLAASRIDPRIAFDFGTEAPVPEIEDPRIYSIRWSGALLAPETGEYEFIIRTEHAARLWINGMKTPVIDAWVKSGDDTEYTVSQYLVGGRAYALRLDFTKAKQGVDDSKKQKEKPPSAHASIELLWQRPRGVPEQIPTRNLSPDSVPETFICATPFQPDDRSYGWERGTAVSEAWDEATTAAAIEAASYVAERANDLARTRENDKDRVKKLRDFSATFAERAFRKPLGDELTRLYVDSQFEAAGDPDLAVRRVVLLALKSPRFLFRELEGGADQFDTASRLSFGLWDSIPDQKLLDAAESGRLATAEEVRRHAERMLGDLRAKSKLREFLLTWLHLGTESDLSKDTEAFPGFDAESIADLRTSLELFLEDVVWSDGSDYRELLLADEVFLNERLAKFYRADETPEEQFKKIKLDGGKRAGVLTHPYVMTRFAYSRETSPIHRGVFLARAVLGRSLRPPPEAFAPLPPELHPDLTTRERVALQTKPPQCMSCHTIINPLGFTLERFDAVGRYRDADGSKPIDDSAVYQSPAGETAHLSGARDLAEYLAGSEEVHAAFIVQLFHHLVQQSVQAYGPPALEGLRESFASRDFHIRQLAVEIMVASALVGRETNAAAQSVTTE